MVIAAAHHMLSFKFPFQRLSTLVRACLAGVLWMDSEQQQQVDSQSIRTSTIRRWNTSSIVRSCQNRINPFPFSFEDHPFSLL